MAVAIIGATANRGRTSGTTKLGTTETPRLGIICFGNAGSGSVMAGVVNGETSSMTIEAWGMQAFQKNIGDSMEALLNPTVQRDGFLI